MKQARKEVETQAQKMLEQGMETQVRCRPWWSGDSSTRSEVCEAGKKGG